MASKVLKTPALKPVASKVVVKSTSSVGKSHIKVPAKVVESSKTSGIKTSSSVSKPLAKVSPAIAKPTSTSKVGTKASAISKSCAVSKSSVVPTATLSTVSKSSSVSKSSAVSKASGVSKPISVIKTSPVTGVSKQLTPSKNFKTVSETPKTIDKISIEAKVAKKPIAKVAVPKAASKPVVKSPATKMVKPAVVETALLKKPSLTAPSSRKPSLTLESPRKPSLTLDSSKTSSLKAATKKTSLKSNDAAVSVNKKSVTAVKVSTCKASPGNPSVKTSPSKPTLKIAAKVGGKPLVAPCKAESLKKDLEEMVAPDSTTNEREEEERVNVKEEAVVCAEVLAAVDRSEIEEEDRGEAVISSEMGADVVSEVETADEEVMEVTAGSSSSAQAVEMETSVHAEAGEISEEGAVCSSDEAMDAEEGGKEMGFPENASEAETMEDGENSEFEVLEKSGIEATAEMSGLELQCKEKIPEEKSCPEPKFESISEVGTFECAKTMKEGEVEAESEAFQTTIQLKPAEESNLSTGMDMLEEGNNELPDSEQNGKFEEFELEPASGSSDSSSCGEHFPAVIETFPTSDEKDTRLSLADSSPNSSPCVSDWVVIPADRDGGRAYSDVTLSPSEGFDCQVEELRVYEEIAGKMIKVLAENPTDSCIIDMDFDHFSNNQTGQMIEKSDEFSEFPDIDAMMEPEEKENHQDQDGFQTIRKKRRQRKNKSKRNRAQECEDVVSEHPTLELDPDVDLDCGSKSNRKRSKKSGRKMIQCDLPPTIDETILYTTPVWKYAL